MSHGGTYTKYDVETRRSEYQPTESSEGNTTSMSTGEWFVVLLVLAIPVVNVGFPLVWAFGGSRPQLKHFGRAVLWLEALGLVLSLIYTFLVARWI